MLRRLIFLALLLAVSPLFAQVANDPIRLHDNWEIQSACKVEGTGESISTTAFHPKSWYRTQVPNTVVGSLVIDKVYPDPDFGMNLRSIPGTTYPIGTIFVHQPMPDDSPFKCAWWYRTEFEVPAAAKGKKVWLHFGGINYRANIFLNGHQIANSDRVAGAWRTYEFEVSDSIVHGKPNVLAVQVWAQTEKDLGINWVDWNPMPPDKDMGLFREVNVTTSGPVSLRAPQVLTKLDTKTLATADLTINAELNNLTQKPVTGELSGDIEASPTTAGEKRIEFTKQVELAPGEIKNVSLTSEELKQLHIEHPRVWWPYQMGKPEMYTLHLSFKVGGQQSDSAKTEFGIREVTSELTDKGYRLFKINGKNILIRGGGWSPDMLYRTSPERQDKELRYVRDIGLNTVRLEGKIETDHFLDTADRMGLLIMPGWCCCSIWEEWDKWTPEDKTIALESLRSQITRLRNHPSVFVWLNGSDNPPPADVEQAYLDVEKELNWPNPTLSSASAKITISGPSGVKMSGPYEYVPPMYWYSDTEMKHGGAYGFNTETSPGPAPMPISSLEKTMPKDKLWPPSEVWDYHSGSGDFKNLNVFNAAMDARYGHPTTLEDYEKRAQLMAYDDERSMFEAYSGQKYTSTGVIQWMLNNAWPSMIWHLYDYYLMPAGGYFGAKKACEPVHVQYNYADNGIYVVNSLYQPFSGLKLHAAVYNIDMTEKFAKDITLDAAEDSSTKAVDLPKIDGLSPTYFVRLDLHDSSGKLLSTNFYWLASTLETLDWPKTTYYVTPVIQHPDLTALNTLPKVELKASSHTVREGGDELVHVTLANPSKSLAFNVSLRMANGRNEDVLPIFMDDNYIALMPGEKRTITVRYKAADLRDSAPVVHVEGWNVAALVLKPVPAEKPEVHKAQGNGD